MQTSQAEPAAQSTLPRVLGPWMGTALVIGTVIGSGVFKKPYAVAKDVPEFGMAMLAWVLVGLLALIGSLAVAELAVLFPKAGGNYVFLREGFGRWAGFLFGWVEFWIIRSASIAALATIFTESLHAVLRGLLQTGTANVLPGWSEPVITAVVILVLGLVNARGTALGGALQLAVTSIKVATLATIAVLPLVAVFLFTDSDAGPSLERLAPIWPDEPLAIDWSKFGAAMVGVIWAYHGWMNLGPVAEEVREPGRNIPLSLIAGTCTVIVLYLLANLAYHLVVPRSEMIAQGKDIPVAALFFLRLLGNIGLMLASAAIMISVFGALNGNLLVGPRLLFAMGRDGLAPRPLAELHASYRTPAVAGLTLTGWSILLVIGVAFLVRFPLPVVTVFSWTFDFNLPAGADAFDVLTDYAMFGSVSFETLAVASLFAFRHRYPKSVVELPYRCPLYPLLPICYVAIMAAVLFNMFLTKQVQSWAAVAFIAVGALVYFVVFGLSKVAVPADQDRLK